VINRSWKLGKLLLRVESRPETWIAGKRLAFSIQTPSIQPPYKIIPKQPKISISHFPRDFFGNIPSAA
jgi:hypothetical protein